MRHVKVVTRALLVIFVALLMTSPFGCARKNFANDPVKWTFVSGDGSWDSNTRNWTFYIGTGETKTMTLELNNTGAKDIMILVQANGPDTIGLHIEGNSTWLLGGNGVGVLAGKSAGLTVSAIARSNFGRPTRFVIYFGWSTNEFLTTSAAL